MAGVSQKTDDPMAVRYRVRQVLCNAEVPVCELLEDHVRMAILQRDQARHLESRYKLALAAILKLPEKYSSGREVAGHAMKLARDALG
jgi:hypothetical protein